MSHLRPRAATLLIGLALLTISLYPFEGWRLVAEPPWAFLFRPASRYLTPADLVSNFLAYIPFGFAIVLAAQHRSGGWRLLAPLAWAVLVSALLSLSVEALQTGLPSRRAEWTDAALNTAGGLLGGLLAGLWLWARRRRHGEHSSEPFSLGLPLLMTLWLLALAAQTDHWLARGHLLAPGLDWRPLQGLGPIVERLLMDAGLSATGLLAVTLVLAARLRLRQSNGLLRPVPLGWIYLTMTAGSLVIKQLLLWGFGHVKAFHDVSWLTPGSLAGVLLGGLLLAAFSCLGSRLRTLLALALLGLQVVLSAGLQASLEGLKASRLPLLGGPTGPWANLEGLTQLAVNTWPLLAAASLLIWTVPFRRKLAG